jgi:regulator of sigma E protease
MDLYWLWVVPVLGVLIVVHELGHFLTAIWLGIRVEEFGIGFPPRVFAIRRKGIDYSLNLLPIGGFVKITGENGDSDDPRSFGKAPAWKRIIVLAAGSFMNLLLAAIIFMVLAISGTLTVDAPATVITTLSSGSNTPQPAEKAGIKPGDRILSIAGIPVTNDESIRTLSSQHGGKPTVYEVERGGVRVPLTVTPNTSMPSLGVILGPYIAPAKVESVRPAGAADEAGFKPGDEVVSVSGHPVTHRAEAMYWLGQGEGIVEVRVKRDGQVLSEPLRLDVGKGSALQKGAALSFFIPTKMVYQSPWEALGTGVKQTWAVITLIPQGIAQAIEGKAQGPGVTGIVGIGQITGEVAQDSGLNGLMRLTALLGISLFLINLLPLPALDGGRLLFIFIELLRGGRRIAPEKEGLVHFAGMVVLLALMLLITIFDVGRLFQGERLIAP